MKKHQVVILSVAYDTEESDPPSTWDWPALIECLPEDIEVLLSGTLYLKDEVNG